MLDAGEDVSSGIVNWSRYAKYAHTLFPEDSFGPALAILDEAKRATGDTGEFAERVDFLRLGLEHAMMCARVSALLAGADPKASPFSANRAIAALGKFRREHESSYISNLTFAAFIEGWSWEVPQGWEGSPVRAVSEQVEPLEEGTYFSLRGGYTLMALLGEGENFRAHIETRHVGRNDAPIRWVLVSQSDEVIERGEIPVTESADLDLPVPEPGTYALFVQTNKNNARVTLLNDHAAMRATSVGFVYQTPRVYFHVPKGMEKFTVSFSGSWPGETVRVRVYDPGGNEVAVEESSHKGEHPIEVTVPEGRDGHAWSLTFEKTDTGVLEDYRVTLGEGLPPYWAHTADRLVLSVED
ncbi:MAG: hypothetical protein J7M38_13765 [Armatimonadetes bacterium]|nr:hypothetical protein [Armatimonadota bacterium]